jgi:hypothetical protein
MTLRPNKSGMPKNPFLHQFLTKPNPLKTLLKPLLSSALRQKIQHQNLTTPSIIPAVKEQLREIYREDILVCQDLIGRDISSWLE